MQRESNSQAHVFQEPELDPTSDRYRICPHPNCKKAHMARNRGKDYCCRKHADDHYNMLRRLKKQAELDQAVRVLLAERAAELLREEELERATNEHLTDGNTASDGTSVGQLDEQAIPAGPSLEMNLNILRRPKLDPIHGSLFSIQELLDQGFHFNHYSTMVPNHNIPESLESNYLTFDKFRAYYVDLKTVLIINKP